MSYLIDTDLLSMLERRNAPAKAVRWIQEHEPEIFLSMVSLAELQFGVEHAPTTHKPALAKWLAETKRKFLPVTEELSEAVLVRWKKLLLELKRKNRTMTCEDSLIAATAPYHGHVVATHNTRHFEPAGVQVFDPLS
jgi:predicted nucleic acid-binding protein